MQKFKAAFEKIKIWFNANYDLDSSEFGLWDYFLLGMVASTVLIYVESAPLALIATAYVFHKCWERK